jgi:ERCC4-related helicase
MGHYVEASITTFKDIMRNNGEKLIGWSSMEKDSVMESLCKLDMTQLLTSIQYDELPNTTNTTHKFQCLLEILREQNNPSFRGIIFVDQRATVMELKELLSAHSGTRDLFNCATFVGMSNDTKKKTELGDLLNPKDQQTTLDDFRNGSKNLIIATNALEEGIDISACNTVICFNKPQNLKSFIQRRGRARAEHSAFFIMLAFDEKTSEVENWRALEQEMIKRYQEEKRSLDKVKEKEAVEERDGEKFSIESTGYVASKTNERYPQLMKD